MISTHAVIITFYPDRDKFRANVNSLLKQVDFIHIVDNTSDDRVLKFLSPLQACINYLGMSENIGVAAALNRGIHSAIISGATHILTMDQDSEIAEGMVRKLLNTFTELKANGEAIAAVAPVYFDIYRNKLKRYHLPQSKWLLNYIDEGETGCDEVLTVITSGCLHSVEAFKKVGYFEEELFIDHVDHEWCFRARNMGMKVFCCWDAHMSHELGDGFVKNRITGRNVIIHSPLRNYYFFRNTFSLFKRSYVPFAWKVFMMANLQLKLLQIVVISPPRFTRLKFIARGLCDGLFSKLGRYGIR